MEENFRQEVSGKRLFLIGVLTLIVVSVLTTLILIFYLQQPLADQQAVEIKQLETVVIESATDSGSMSATPSASPSSLLDVRD